MRRNKHPFSIYYFGRRKIIDASYSNDKSYGVNRLSYYMIWPAQPTYGTEKPELTHRYLQSGAGANERRALAGSLEDILLRLDQAYRR